MYAPACTLCPVQLCKINGDAGQYTFMSVQGVARPESGMNVYGLTLPLTLQDLAQGTMCMQGHTCVCHKVMMMHRLLTFKTEVGVSSSFATKGGLLEKTFDLSLVLF